MTLRDAMEVAIERGLHAHDYFDRRADLKEAAATLRRWMEFQNVIAQLYSLLDRMYPYESMKDRMDRQAQLETRALAAYRAAIAEEGKK